MWCPGLRKPGLGVSKRPWDPHIYENISVPFDFYEISSVDNCVSVHEQGGVSSLAWTFEVELLLFPPTQFSGGRKLGTHDHLLQFLLVSR